jgi:hypothetical protein
MKSIKVKTGCRDCPLCHPQSVVTWKFECMALKNVVTIGNDVLESNSNEWLSLDNCPLIKQGVVSVIPVIDKFSQRRPKKVISNKGAAKRKDAEPRLETHDYYKLKKHVQNHDWQVEHNVGYEYNMKWFCKKCGKVVYRIEDGAPPKNGCVG